MAIVELHSLAPVDVKGRPDLLKSRPRGATDKNLTKQISIGSLL